VKWDKPTPHGTGPFYTKVVDKHPLTQQEILRVETDRGSYLMPELALWDGKPPTEEQVSRLNVLLDVLKTNLNDNLEIRYSQLWEEGDILIVDLFRMYHSVMGGFTAGQRKFTGIGIRPKIYDNSMYTTMELWTDK
jgi:alpha-ketoglutarate-dependent taurine dioxygenase